MDKKHLNYSYCSNDYCVQLHFPHVTKILIGADLGLNSSSVSRLCDDKFFTAQILSQNNVAVIKGDLHEAGHAYANYPVKGSLLVKPNTGRSGQNVLPVKDLLSLNNALFCVTKNANLALVQPFVDKPEFRLMVLDGNIYFAYQRLRGSLIADGLGSMMALIKERNATQASIDYNDQRLLAALKLQGLSLESVPPAGAQVTLFYNANLSCAGNHRWHNNAIDKRYVAIARRCHDVLGVRYSGIDIFANSLEHFDPNYRVIEVNTKPGFNHIDCTKKSVAHFIDRLAEAVVE
jgi:D-alanine-D-alanine ligase-like ATP-grasp enzyme